MLKNQKCGRGAKPVGFGQVVANTMHLRFSYLDYRSFKLAERSSRQKITLSKHEHEGHGWRDDQAAPRTC
jgi:hypothetical protein